MTTTILRSQTAQWNTRPMIMRSSNDYQDIDARPAAGLDARPAADLDPPRRAGGRDRRHGR